MLWGQVYVFSLHLACCVALFMMLFSTSFGKDTFGDRYAGLFISSFFFFFSPLMPCLLYKDWSMFKFCTYASRSSCSYYVHSQSDFYFFLTQTPFFNQAPQFWTVFQEKKAPGSSPSMEWVSGNLNVNPHPVGACLQENDVCSMYIFVSIINPPNNLWKIVLSWCAIKLKDLRRVSQPALFISL